MNKPLPLILLLGALTGCGHTAPLTLVQNGQPNATIVVQHDAPAQIADAAVELQEYITKISGVQLPLKTDGKEVPGINLNIGKTEATRDSDFPDATLNPETYVIRQREDDLYFTGNYPSPTAFAVYAFLQDQLGVRWFAPGEDWEFVPQNTSGTLATEVESIVRTPEFSPRLWTGHYWTDDWVKWNVRNRTWQSERVLRRQFQNKIYTIFPPSKYAKEHPEYYPLTAGKRWIPADDKNERWWPCIGNPEVQRLTIEHIRQHFDQNPNADSFSLGMDDIHHRCSCSLCQQLDANPGYSNRYYKFVNIVAKEIKKTHPDKYIGVLIYHIVRSLPSEVPKLEDNVFGYITQNSANWFNPATRKADQDLTREWAKRVKHLSRYDYMGLSSFTPRFYPHLLDEAIKFDKALGLEGMYSETYTFLPHTAPMLWCLAQLQWNAQQNVDVLLEDFYNKMYPSTHQQMKSYFNLLEKSWSTGRHPRFGSRSSWVHRDVVRQAVSISAADTRTGQKLLDAAYDAATTPIEKRRIDVARQGLKSASYVILGYDLAQHLAAFSPQNAQQAEAGLKLVRRFSALVHERNVYWTQAREQQNLFGENLRGLDTRGDFLFNTRNLQTSISQLDAPAQNGITRIAQWYHQNQPERAVQITNELLGLLPPGKTVDILETLNRLVTQPPASLTQNGNMEDLQTEKPTGVPVNWKTWSNQKGAQYSIVPGHNAGNGTQVLAPLTGKAIVQQSVPVLAGKQYVAIVWVKPASQEDATHTAFTLRLRTEKDWFTGKTALQATSAKRGDWQRLLLWITIPKGATSVAIQLSTANGASAVFDDAALYEVH